MFEYCKEKGLVDDNYDVSLYNHQSPANCFCTDIKPDRFRMLTSQIEKMVDHKNYRNRMRKIFSFDIFWRIRELGIRGSLKKALTILLGR
jgi:hypothetical protein